MRRQALLFSGPGRVEIVEEAVPAPASDEMLVRTISSAISTGTELLIYRGLAPAGLAADETIGALAGTLAFPLKYGYAVVGEVMACGADVAPGWTGRRVFAFHPHETHFVARPDDLLPVPDDIPSETAALLPNMETAINLLHDGSPLVGEQVAVLGQGIVGLLTTALLARLPLARLVTLDPIAVRRQQSLATGAYESIDPTPADAVTTVLAALDATGGAYRGADLTFELSGSPAALNLALALTGYHGRIVIGSWYGRKPVNLDLGGRFHRSRIQLLASQVSRIAPELAGRWSKQRRYEAAWQALRQIAPARFVTHRYPLARAAEAYTLLDRHPETALQVLLTYDDHDL